MITLFMVKILISVVAVIMFFTSHWLILRAFDKLLGLNFKDGMAIVTTSPDALSRYYSYRFVGVCIAMGLIVCIAFIV